MELLRELGTDAWTNIALAKAVSGDFDNAIWMLRFGSFSRFDQSSQPEMLSDAAAIGLQQFEENGDVHVLLRALGDADQALEDRRFGRLPIPVDGRHHRSRPEIPEAHFNRALALEKLGLWRQAVAAYRHSQQVEHSTAWWTETFVRIRALSHLSLEERWLSARAKLEQASQRKELREVARIAKVFPQHTRAAGEKEYLGTWGRSVLLGDASRARRALDIARDIGRAHREATGDLLLADAVRVIDEANSRSEARSIEALARAHQIYAQTTIDRFRENSASAAAFDEAASLFQLGGSPMAELARFQGLVARVGTAPVDESLEMLRQIQRRVSARHLTLRALIEAEIANRLADGGDPCDALETYTRAHNMFERLGEIDGVARMRTSAASMLTLSGQYVEAWRLRRQAIRIGDDSGDPLLMEFVISQAANDEIYDREEQAALTLYSALFPLPPLHALPQPGWTSNRWRSPMKLFPAEVMLATPDILRADVRDDVRVAQAVGLSQRKPSDAEALLTESISYAHATGRRLMLPYVHFYRALARQAAQDEEGAIADLRQSIELLEERRMRIGRPDLRDIWLRTAGDAVEVLTELHWSRREDDQAFTIGERRRALVFRDGVGVTTRKTEVLSANEIASRLPPDVAIIVTTSSSRHTMVTSIENGHVAMHHVEQPTGAFLRKKRVVYKAIAQRRPSDVMTAGEDLYDLIIAPLGLTPTRVKRLVIVADQPLHDFPFSALRDRKSGQYLAEQYELLRVPSASVFAQTKLTDMPMLPRGAIIGDPAFDRRLYPNLPSLPAARRESSGIARMYPAARVLIVRHATFGNLARAASNADVLHIGAHTIPSAEESSLLKFLLAPAGTHNGACSLSEIASLPLKKGVTVVLAGCRTGTSREPGTLRDFAGAFLAAGAGTVVATLWDVDDATTREFSRRFHEALRQKHSAAEAAQAAQQFMIRSPHPAFRDPAAWSGFQVYTLGH